MLLLFHLSFYLNGKIQTLGSRPKGQTKKRIAHRETEAPTKNLTECNGAQQTEPKQSQLWRHPIVLQSRSPVFFLQKL